MAVLRLLWMIAYVALHGASGHRVQKVAVSDQRVAKTELGAPEEEEMRKEAVKSFKPPTVWMPTLDLKKLFMHKVNLHRNSNTTIFEQTRNAFEYEDPRAWGANWTGLFFTVNFTNEKGVDSFGLRKEWLSLVLQSIVLPAGHSDKTGLQCVSSGKCGDEGTPQYLLKALPSGELVPISVEEVETSEQTGRIGSMLKFAYDAYDLAYERVLGEKEKLPYAARMRFQFLGKWLARAHIVTDLGFAPMGLHRVIYQSLVAGYVVTPQTPSFYSEEDTIPACEKLAAIWRRRSPQELQSYGWLSCDEVKDHTGKYTQASCYKPIFRDEMMWNALYLAWGSLAPDGAKADDTVPFSAARDFTERRCEQSWKAFEEPVKYIVQGFREVIPSTSGLWKLLDGKWQKLSHLIEGSSEVNVDEMLKAVSWTCSSEEEAVIIEVLHDLQKQGQDLPPVKRQLNKLLRFFTGSFKPPVEGWKKDTVEFTCVNPGYTGGKCVPLVGKTCFNELRIPRACCKDPATLKAMIAESVVSEGFGYD
ncbi:HECT domain-containing protein [Durusdinium trenchii]|uniref:HECT domain-containing protein n=1 Tax=Durusdinium trenchii TaxID=1381693 RepID=A0ABP0Q7Q6_9DINO